MAEERMLITGGQRLEGIVHVSGGKNTSVAVISASILSQTPCVIENLPNIEDVNVSVETLRHLGAKVIWDPDAGVMEVDSSTINRTDVRWNSAAACARPRITSAHCWRASGGRRCLCRADAILGADRLISTSKVCAPSAQRWKPRAAWCWPKPTS